MLIWGINIAIGTALQHFGSNISVPLCRQSAFAWPSAALQQRADKVLKPKCCLWARVPHFTNKGEGRQRDIPEVAVTLDEISSFPPCVQS